MLQTPAVCGEGPAWHRESSRTMPRTALGARDTVRRRVLTALGVLTAVATVLHPTGTVVRAQGTEQAMFVSVLDSGGAPVHELVSSDFVIVEDGNEREVIRVERATAPMQLAVLVDTSAAAAFATSDIRSGLDAFVTVLHEGNEIALVAFGERPRILAESTGRIDRLRDGIDRVFAFPNTAAYLLDALVETARGFERRASSRPVIVVVTSEGLDYSNQDSGQVLRALTAARVATHVIVLKSERAPLRASPFGGITPERSLIERNVVLARGPATTGGLRRELLMSSAVGDTLNRLAEILASQYEVVYSRPASLIPPKQIAVRMRRDDLTAQGTPVRQ